MHKAMRQVFVAAGVGLLVGGTEALAQEVVRVRGTIERIQGDVYIVQARDGYCDARV